MYMCKVFSSNRKKLKKRKCDLHEISFASPKAAFLKHFFRRPKIAKNNDLQMTATQINLSEHILK